MKLIKAVVCFVTVAVALASAGERYNVTFSRPATVGGTTLKAGDYRVDVADGKAKISNGKHSVEAPVRVETVDQKFDSTGVRYSTNGGSYAVEEIRVGGSKTKLVFAQGTETAVR